MSAEDLTRIALQGIYLVLWVSAPALGASLLAGLVVGLFQSMTQLQEPSLSFVPKLLAVGVALIVSGAWMGSELVGFTRTLFLAIPSLFPG